VEEVKRVLNPIPPFNVSFEWEGLTDSTQSEWPFSGSQSVGDKLKALFKGPKIYRFVFYKSPKKWAYVGESQNFTLRYLRYRCKPNLSKAEATTEEGLAKALNNLHSNPNVRISTAIETASNSNEKVEFQIFKFNEFTFNGALIREQDLACPFTRKALENFAILDTRTSGMHVMNRGHDFRTHDWRQRRLERVKKRLSDEAKGR
jgi:hypothetical protein